MFSNHSTCSQSEQTDQHECTSMTCRLRPVTWAEGIQIQSCKPQQQRSVLACSPIGCIQFVDEVVCNGLCHVFQLQYFFKNMLDVQQGSANLLNPPVSRKG